MALLLNHRIDELREDVLRIVHSMKDFRLEMVHMHDDPPENPKHLPFCTPFEDFKKIRDGYCSFKATDPDRMENYCGDLDGSDVLDEE
jgi:hypothetical protein